MLGKTSVRLVFATWGLFQRDAHAVRSVDLEFEALSRDYDVENSQSNVSNTGRQGNQVVSPAPCLQLNSWFPELQRNCHYALSPVAKQGGCLKPTGTNPFEKHCNTMTCAVAKDTVRTSKSLSLDATIPLWGVPLAEINAVLGGKAAVEYQGAIGEPGVKSIFLSASIGVEINLGFKWFGAKISFKFVGSLTIECSRCRHFTTLWSGLLTQLIYSSKNEKIGGINLWGSDVESVQSKYQKTWAFIQESIPTIEQLDAVRATSEGMFVSIVMDVRWVGEFEAKAEVHAEIPGVLSVEGGLKIVPSMEKHYVMVIHRGRIEDNLEVSEDWVTEMEPVAETKVFKVSANHFLSAVGKVDVEAFCDGEALEFKVVLESTGETFKDQVEETAQKLEDVAKENLDLAITGVKDIEKTITDTLTTSLDEVETKFQAAIKVENFVASSLPTLTVNDWITSLKQLLVDDFGTAQVATYCNTANAVASKQSAIAALAKIQKHFTKLVWSRHSQGVETLTVRVLADASANSIEYGIPLYCRNVLNSKGKVATIRLVRTEEDTNREPAKNQVEIYQQLLQKDARGEQSDTKTVFKSEAAKWVEKGLGIKTHTMTDLIAAELATDDGLKKIEAFEAIPPAKGPTERVAETVVPMQWLELPERTHRFAWEDVVRPN